MEPGDQVRSEGISLRTTVMAQQSKIVELWAADHRRQTVISDLLAADHRRQRQLVKALKIVKSLKTQMIELQRQHLLSIMGYPQLADGIDLLFRLATQYRSFAQILAILYSILSVTSISWLKMAPKRRTTRTATTITTTTATTTTQSPRANYQCHRCFVWSVRLQPLQKDPHGRTEQEIGNAVATYAVELQASNPDNNLLTDGSRNKCGHLELNIISSQEPRSICYKDVPSFWHILTSGDWRQVKEKQLQDVSTSKHEEASEDNIGVVEERELLCKIFQVQFGFPKLQFLGHVIDNKAFHVDPSISNPLKIGTLLRHQRRFSVLCACWTEARKPEISTRGCWRVGDDCYTSSASEEPEQVHITFHVSNLNKSWQRTLDVPLDGLQFDDSISLSRGTIESQIRSQTVLNKAYHQLSQVRWNFKRGPEFTWEREDQFRKK
ncbi:hypothetical protein Tco_0526486 [Tanacetum coccineum]